ncbi:alpha/beta-hydrolase [Lindgomyces ingoldianus]|uniref:Alpha/beta-hydrolase n=1 Tax=Lindgomyces ingoldianus TaxID=673940 RepID=A0ACB6QE32_9PLEO|nr:alpha/beta-hydrolase [Lindgomyces ingoldianus]KAF2465174.1 alpha/beta-hydrolase [Lindgomyces ingoldianus]
MSDAVPLPAACCAQNAVQSDYKPQGTYIPLANLNVYVTGSESASRAILFFFDVFGLAPQTLQGADILAKSMGFVVLVPDFFHGEPLGLDVFPIDNDNKRERAKVFISTTADFTKNKPVALQVQTAAAEKFPSIKSWGAFGLCWGGKMTAILSGPESTFKAAGTAHPGYVRLDSSDAAQISIPYICLFSKEDGTPEQVQAYEKTLKNSNANVVETFANMHHGWMGARARLEDPENVTEYCRGYSLVGDFFDMHL